jgi:hypothetical protein
MRAASRERFTTAPQVTTVRSVPSLATTFALPKGIMKSGPGYGLLL